MRALITGLTRPAAGAVYTFNGMFVDDLMADVLKLFIYLAVAAMLVYSRGYTR